MSSRSGWCFGPCSLSGSVLGLAAGGSVCSWAKATAGPVSRPRTLKIIAAARGGLEIRLFMFSGSGRDQQLVHAKYRVEVVALVARGVTAQEEFQAGDRARGKRGVSRQAAVELGAQLRILRQHLARDPLSHVRLHVLLLLEAC